MVGGGDGQHQASIWHQPIILRKPHEKWKKQESPPVWMQEAYPWPWCIKYSTYAVLSQGVGTLGYPLPHPGLAEGR